MIGLIESQSSESVVVIDGAGQKRTIPRREIESIIEVPVSLMPPGLDQAMTPAELRDLVAYLLGNQ